MRLFEVTFRDFKHFYVEANGYDEAVEKAMAYRVEEKNYILDNDGNLKKESESDVKEVKVAAERVIR